MTRKLPRRQGIFRKSLSLFPDVVLPKPWVTAWDQTGDTKSPNIYCCDKMADDSCISRPGIVTGLVAYSSGGNGSILFIEVADMPGSGSVQLTGKLGDVLKESVEVALSWVKAHAYELGLTADPSENIMKNRSIHVHCPSGAIPKVR